MYFDADTLKKISGPKKEDCCKLNDAFTNIYDEGKFYGEWLDTSNCDRNIAYTSGCLQGSTKCLRVNFVDWKCLQFYNRIKPETKRYESIEFYIKTEKECKDCLKLKTGEKDFIRISTNEAGKWEKKVIKLSDLGITEDKFRNFLFQGSTKESQIIYFDDIKLVKSNYVDNGLCHDNNLNEEGGSSAGFIVIIIIILLIGIGVGLFFFWRYKKRTDIMGKIGSIN